VINVTYLSIKKDDFDFIGIDTPLLLSPTQINFNIPLAYCIYCSNTKFGSPVCYEFKQHNERACKLCLLRMLVVNLG